jgi:hypothetical protein
MKNESFILKASLKTPVMTTQPIHIDGLLLAVREQRFGDEANGMPFPELALADGIFRASAGIFVSSGLTPINLATHKTVKRLRLNGGSDDGMFVPQTRFISKTHLHRPYIGEYPTVEGAVALVWQCVGDPGACLSLARVIRNVGGRRNGGYGAVAEWEALPCRADPDSAGWRGGGGEVLRHLPRAWFGPNLPDGAVATTGRVQPSYGDSEGSLEIAAPTLESMTMSGRAAREMLAY